MKTQIPLQRKIMQLFLSMISAYGFLGVGVVVLALGIMVLPFRSSAASVVQSGNEKGDAKRGQTVFDKRCAGCHSLDEDKEGPRLRGIFGKKAASISTFKYSDALKASNVTWDAPSLDQWMADPEKIVPNSDMFFRVPRAGERTDVIAYLQTLSDK
jgi:cytochrome c